MILTHHLPSVYDLEFPGATGMYESDSPSRAETTLCNVLFVVAAQYSKTKAPHGETRGLARTFGQCISSLVRHMEAHKAIESAVGAVITGIHICFVRATRNNEEDVMPYVLSRTVLLSLTPSPTRVTPRYPIRSHIAAANTATISDAKREGIPAQLSLDLLAPITATPRKRQRSTRSKGTTQSTKGDPVCIGTNQGAGKASLGEDTTESVLDSADVPIGFVFLVALVHSMHTVVNASLPVLPDSTAALLRCSPAWRLTLEDWRGGGFARIHQVTTTAGRQCVLKTVRQPADVWQLYQEAQALNQVKGMPSIIQLEHTVVQNGIIVGLVLSPVGEDLSRGPGAAKQTLQATLDALCGLRALHSAKLGHTDVRPSNIIHVPSTGTACLIDLGLCVALGTERRGVNGVDAYLHDDILRACATRPMTPYTVARKHDYAGLAYTMVALHWDTTVHGQVPWKDASTNTEACRECRAEWLEKNLSSFFPPGWCAVFNALLQVDECEAHDAQLDSIAVQLQRLLSTH
jgi:hypothetical protein